jgi:hypothetical protein
MRPQPLATECSRCGAIAEALLESGGSGSRDEMREEAEPSTCVTRRRTGLDRGDAQIQRAVVARQRTLESELKQMHRRMHRRCRSWRHRRRVDVELLL